MDVWLERIIKIDRDTEPEVVDGMRQTTAPVHLFDAVHKQINVVAETKSPRLIILVLKEIVQALISYQTSLIELCTKNWMDLEFVYLIAVVNNSSRCYDFTQDLMDRVSKLLPEQYLSEIDFDPVLDGFHKVCKEAVAALTNVCYNDMGEVFVKLFNRDWQALHTRTIYIVNSINFIDRYEGDLIGMVIGTLEDYFDNELQELMDSYVRRFAQDCLDRLIYKYAYEMLTKKHAFNQATVEKMTDDIGSIRDFFTKHMKPAFFESQIKVLEDLKELLDSEPDMICLYFDSLLRNHANVTLRLVEIILRQREDLSKAQQKEAILGCKDILDNYTPDPNNHPKEGLFTKLNL